MMNFNVRPNLTLRLTSALQQFSPTLKQLVLTLVCLQAVAISAFLNTLVSVALVTLLTVGIVRYYQIDPEPVLLLLLHVLLSAFMLGDPTSTLALVVTGVAAVHILGDVEYPREKILVVALSLGSTLLFRTFTAILCSAALAAVIVVWRLRPLSPHTISLFGLLLLGISLLLDRTLGCALILVYSALVIAIYVAAKITHSSMTEAEPRRPPDKKFPNGFLPLSSTAESLDLHGHTVTGAMRVVHEYLREREDEYRENRSQHLRHATIITGAGSGSRHSGGEHDQASLIKPTVINFLKINKYRYESSSETPGLIRVDLESHAL
ncbi:hypothetical protein PoB_001461600 [Plakobranchus ocellatus]|uniref:Smr domain-containing protein n=1 Tax=Plakobranchus ocellatus TaxID=259542 RepID=A0AAV3YX80_9GAST|nr:hypothetical protein PoB_001461600 [Plakobranchus ocellatus]